MWPHKAGLGVRLSYGVFGNPNVEIESVSNKNTILNDELQPKVTFPRKEGDRSEAQYLNEVSSKPLLKKPLNHSVGELYKSSVTNSSFGSDDGNFGTTSIPYKIISSYGLETKAIDSPIAYDPCFGDIVQIFKIIPRSQNKVVDGLVHVTGESLSVLSLSIRLQDGDSIKLSPAYEVDFLDQIRQVKVAESKEKNRLIILVRTRVKIYVTTCKLAHYSSSSKSGPDFKLSIIKEIYSQKLNQSTFADVAVCSEDIRKFATVDVNGILSVWMINKRYDKVLRLSNTDLQLLMVDANNLSHWLRITWLPKLNGILLSTRTKIFQHDFDTGSQKVLVTSNTWSRIRDVQCVGNMIFYLTSKELIWLRCETEIERLLSWRHFLNDEDPSLKLSLYTEDNSYLLFIHSQASPLVLVYTFGFENEKPSSLRDPYMVQGSNTTGLKQLIPLGMSHGSDIVTLELSSNLHLQQRCLQLGQLTQHPSKTESHNELEEKTKKNHRHKHHHLKKLHAALIKSTSKIEDEELVVAIQKYASLLGTALEADAQEQRLSSGGFHSLLEVDHRAPLGILDLGELDDMIAELENSSLTSEINIKSFINNGIIQRNGFLKIPQAQTHIFDIHTMLEEVFGKCNAERSITNSAIVLGLSLIKCQAQTNRFESKFEEQKISSHEHIQKMLNEWDTTTSSQTDQQYDSQTYNKSQNVPPLKSSQMEPMEPPKLSQSSSSQLGGLINSMKGSESTHPASQQRSQSRLRDTLRISSQRSSQGGSQPKRKKKKGGF